MTHLFYLDNAPFFKICSGEKTIELRLNDEKRRKLKTGDKIIFTNRDDERQIISVVVTELHCFGNFEELYAALPLDRCGYTEEELPHAKSEDMEKYYSKKDIKKYGVVGIEFELTDPKSVYDSGLVLEGGGIRGLYTSGVLDAFMEQGIEFPYVIGVSAGSCNGVSFIGKNLHRMKNITIQYSGDERYKSVKSLVKNGEYLNSKWIFGELSYRLFPLNYEEYEKSNSVMCAVCTNAATGKPEYFYPKSFRNGCEELRASCALPIATKPVKLGRDYYFDGGVSDSIPLKRAFDDGCKKCVVILTQDLNFVKKPVGHAAAVRQALRKYPKTAEAVLNRHNMYNDERKYVFEQEKLGSTLVICPEKPLDCGTLNVSEEKQRIIYNLGYRQGLASADKVKKFIAGD